MALYIINMYVWEWSICHSREGGNPDSRLDITPTANYAERKNLL
jgi:hypothetical protein